MGINLPLLLIFTNPLDLSSKRTLETGKVIRIRGRLLTAPLYLELYFLSIRPKGLISFLEVRRHGDCQMLKPIKLAFLRRKWMILVLVADNVRERFLVKNLRRISTIAITSFLLPQINKRKSSA